MSKLIPILFSTAMVQAILQGRKTVTRRVCKQLANASGVKDVYHRPDGLFTGLHLPVGQGQGVTQPFLCRHGQPGDILWVRESFYAWGRWRLTGKLTDTGKPEKEFIDETNLAGNYCFIDNPPADIVKGQPLNVYGWYKRPSMFMPFDACRIWLKITGIRLDRLHDITEEQAAAEGVESVIASKEKFGCRAAGMKLFRRYDRSDNSLNDHPCNGYDSARISFESLWEKINGRKSWEANPWVWVVEFETTEKPVMV